LKEVDKADMKRYILKAIIQMCGKAILITMIAGIVIGVIGNLNKWDTPRAYSDAFFIAGCLFIVAGGMSRLAAGRERNKFLLLDSDRSNDRSSGDRENSIIEASSPASLAILGLLGGSLLILISAFVIILF
jgi:hypothetical protein